MSEHSHEIGPANLPYTRRGRKAAAEAQSRSRTRNRAALDDGSDVQKDGSSSPQLSPEQPAENMGAPPPMHIDPQVRGPEELANHVAPPTFQSAIMAIGQPPPPPLQPQPVDLTQERWDRMTVLFQGIREHARTFEYPAPSIAALESVLIRLYLESPMGAGTYAAMSILDGLTGTHAGALNGG